MSTVNVGETIDSRWKVLNSAARKACVEEACLGERKSRPFISYEQFVEETRSTQSYRERLQKSGDGINNDAATVTELGKVKAHDIYALGDWKSDEYADTCDDDGEDSGREQSVSITYRQRKGKFKRKHRSNKFKAFPENLELFMDKSSSSKIGKKILFKDSNNNVHSDADSWESLDSSSDDNKDFDEFLASSKENPPNNDDDLKICMPYTCLTDHLLTRYHLDPEPQTAGLDLYDNYKRARKREHDSHKDFQRSGPTLEERLPLMQVLDVLDDVNAVLKVGKITPRMERILEYKQDYPFAEGYEEEQLGWCPWLVYKLAKICKRIGSKQWPY